MAEISITKWLDPGLSYFARQSGIPVDQYSPQVGGEGIANGLEMTADFFTKGWLNKAVQGVAGLIASSYAIWGKDVPTRLRRELLAIGTHELLRITEAKPAEIAEVRRSLDQTISAAQRGDMNAALSSVLTTPAEIQAAMGGIAPAGIGGAGGSPPPAAEGGQSSYSVKPETPKPATGASRSKYTITG